MAAVRVVTDSTASLVPGRADRAGMIVVPLQVVLDGTSVPEACDGAGDPRTAADGVANITGSEVAAALRAGRRVSTSRPSPEVFAEHYRRAEREGADAVVSVHLSRAISGTYDAAVAAAGRATIPVTVVDSGTVVMALGYAALSGAALAAEAASAAEVSALISRRAAAASAFFCVDSLEYLRRGGRIGAAQALLGSALSIKPLLTVADGIVAPYERVRTRAKAVARLEALAREAAVTDAVARAVAGDGHEPSAADLAVHHLDDAAGATALGERLHATLAEARVPVGELSVSEISAVVGVHVGPGTLGVVIAPRVR